MRSGGESGPDADLGIVAARLAVTPRHLPAPRPRQQALPTNYAAGGVHVRVLIGGAAPSNFHAAVIQLTLLLSRRGHSRFPISFMLAMLVCPMGLTRYLRLTPTSGLLNSPPLHLSSLLLTVHNEVREIEPRGWPFPGHDIGAAVTCIFRRFHGHPLMRAGASFSMPT